MRRVLTSGLYYKNIFMIVSDNRKWSLYYSVIYDRHLTLASVINYDRKWRYNLERHTSGVNYDRNKFIIQATNGQGWGFERQT
jgi:hypothetical protein